MRLPIIIGLRRSRLQQDFLAAVLLLASFCALFFPQAHAIRAALLLAAWGIAAWAWRRLAPPLSAIRLEADGSIWANPHQQEFLPATILPGATVHPWLTVLRFELPDGKRRALLVTADTATPDDFRRLRVFLRWRADFTSG